MTLLDFLFGSASTVSQKYRAQAIATNLELLRTRLANEPLIRLYADRGGGKGQQAAAVTLLNRINAAATAEVPGLAFTGVGKSVDLVYDDGMRETLGNLQQLLGFGTSTTGSYRGIATVRLIKKSDCPHGLTGTVDFGFSGATDSDESAQGGLCTIMATRVHLRLQPFLYGKPEQIFFADNPAGTIDLTTIPEVGGSAFRQTGFRVPLPDTPFDWAPYLTDGSPDQRRRAEVLQHLVNFQTSPTTGKRYELLVTYGVHSLHWRDGTTGHTSAFGSHPTEQVVELVLGAMAAQTRKDGTVLPGALPVVIVNLDDFFADVEYPTPASLPRTPGIQFQPVAGLLDGGATAREAQILGCTALVPWDASRVLKNNTTLQTNSAAIWSNRAGLLRSMVGNSASRFTALDDPTRIAVTDTLNDLLDAKNANARVLWVQLAPPFGPDLFNYVLSCSTMPSLFEGNNTANQALVFGRIYYHAARPGDARILYPTEVLAHSPATATVQNLQNAANVVRLPLSEWPSSSWSSYDGYPPFVFAGPFIAYRDQAEKDKYGSYFRDIGAFYSDPLNDKLNLGFAYLAQVMPPPVVPVMLAAGPLAAAADANPLDALYDSLASNLVGGPGDLTLNLIPGALTAQFGAISRLLDALLTQAAGGLEVVLGKASLAPYPKPNPLDKITVGGRFVLAGVDARFEGTFTAPDGKLTAAVTVEVPMPEIPGLQWVPLESAKLTVAVAQQGSVPAITVVCRAAWPGDGDNGRLTLSWALPVQNNKFRLSGAFHHPYPSIDEAFRLAGGLNVVAALPPPFSAIADLGLAEFELAYDTSKKSVDFLSFIVRQSSPIPLFGGVSLQDVALTLSVSDASNLSERRTTAALESSFVIGKANDPDAGVVQVGARLPDFVLNGQLASGRILLADLLSTFDLDVTICGDNPPQISALAFNYDSKAKTGLLSVALGLSMSLEVGQLKPLTVKSIGLLIERAGETTGKLTGDFVLLEGTPNALPLSLIAAYGGADAGWAFEARQVLGELKLFAFIATYLGSDFSFSQDLTLADLLLTISFGKQKKYEFSGRMARPFTIDFLELEVVGSFKIGYLGPAAANSLSSVAEATGPIRLPAVALPRPAHVVNRPLSARARVAQARRSAGRAPVALLAEAPLGATGDQGGLYGELGLVAGWHGVELDVTYKFNKAKPPDDSQEVVVGLKLDGTLVATADITKAKGETIAKFRLAQDTLGGIVETFVSWAMGGQKFGLAAPWNILNSVPVGAFEIDFNFTKKQVTFALNLGPIRLGPVTIQSIGLAYDPATKAVNVEVSVQFVWKSAPENLNWNAADPASTKSWPGTGNSYFDLRLLMLGQHLELQSGASYKRVQPLIDALATLPLPSGDQVPVPLRSTDDKLTLDYAREAGWLVATDFGILRIDGDDGKPTGDYFLQLSIVFNDPSLYALRIALAGKAAKIFAGLEFEILYQQVSSTVGVYRTRIALPTVMRSFQAGAVGITLPDFAIGVYTNGDFEIDVGFPWNNNFAASFTIQVQAGPFPVMGSGGFYFSKLSDATKSQVPPGTSVPAATNGTFNPVLAFGFGVQLGLGKSVSAGILEAGFSITAFGIVQGVLAKWHPSSGVIPGGSGELQGQYYFQLVGTFGIIGRLYGSINFAIVSARVDIEIKLYLQIEYASYAPIVISAVASVDARLTVSINLGLFKINIHLSFSATVKATFTLEVGDTNPPWTVSSGAPLARLLRPAATRLSHARVRLLAADAGPVWNGRLLAPSQGGPKSLQATFGPALTATGELPGGLGTQTACYVAMISLQGPDPAVDPAAGQAPSDGSSFEILCDLVGLWIGASVQSTPGDSTAIRSRPITAEQLTSIVAALGSDSAFPIPLADIDAFLRDQVSVGVAIPAARPRAQNGVVFPMAPDLRLVVPAADGIPGIDYTFGGYNQTVPGYLETLRRQVEQLAIQVGHEEGAAGVCSAAAGANGPSVGSFVFGAWFAMLARQIANAMLQGLRTFHYSGSLTQTLADIVQDLANRLGIVVSDEDLLLANAQHPLNDARALTVFGAPLVSREGQTFAAVAAGAFNPPADQPYFDGTALASVPDNALAPLRSAKFTLDNAVQECRAGETLTTLSKRLGLKVPELLSRSDVVAQVPLESLSTLRAPAFAYTTRQGDTFEGLAGRFSVSVASFAEVLPGILGPGPNFKVPDLFSSQGADAFLAIAHLDSANVGALLDEAAATGTYRHAAGMVSRFMLHGLRLPARDQVIPQAPGLFVQQAGQGGTGYVYAVDEAGLYALTGQEFALPGSLPAQGYGVTLSRDSAAVTWLSLGSDGLTVTYTPVPEDAARVAALQAYVVANTLDLQVLSVGPETPAARHPAALSVQSGVPWLAAGPVNLPAGGTVEPGTPLTLLQFTSELTGLAADLLTVPGESGQPARIVARPLPPVFSLRQVRYHEGTGESSLDALDSYGWGTLLSFRVRHLGAATTGATLDCYELVGASTSDIVLLERLLASLGSGDGNIAAVTLLYPTGANSVQAYVSDAWAGTYLGIVQSNLSTVTHPPTSFALSAALAAPPARTLNGSFAEFLRLLWEASITRAAGFYLYYFDANRGAGLPDSVFNDRGEAVLSLFVMYSAASPDGDPIPSYVNAAATGQGIAGQHAAVVALARSPSVSPGLAGTLEEIAFQAYTTADEVARAAATANLQPGVALQVGGGIYQVAPGTVAPGGGLAQIAAWFGVDADAVKRANPRITEAQWASPLPAFTAVRLPAASVTVGQGNAGSTLGSIAGYYGTTVAQLGADNRSVTGLFVGGQSATLATGPFVVSATVPVGVVSYLASRQAPPESAVVTDSSTTSDPPPFVPADFLRSLYTMLGFRVARNQDFQDVPGLPAGPKTGGSKGTGRLRVPVAAADGVWSYTLPVPSWKCLPAGEVGSDPYVALGRVLQVELAWQDVFGNRIQTSADNGLVAPGRLNRVPAPTGYTDRLLGASQWPSVAPSWEVADSEKPAVTLRLTFDASRYQVQPADPSSTGAPPPDPAKLAARDLAIYRVVHRQLNDPNGIAFSLETSLSADRTIGMAPPDRTRLLAWIDSIAAYLEAVARPSASPVVPALEESFAFPLGNVFTEQLIQVSVSFVIGRASELVLDAFRDLPGVASIVTPLVPAVAAVSPPTAAEPQGSAPSIASSLAEFAARLETRLSTQVSAVKLAVGVDRYAGSSRAAGQTLWVVRVLQGQGGGIGFDLAQMVAPGIRAPLVLARAPLSRSLETRSNVAIWKFDGKNPIDFNQPRTTTQSFVNIDVESWALAFGTTVDRLLGPDLATPAMIVDAAHPPATGQKSCLDRLRAAKQLAAGSISRFVVPVFKDDPTAPPGLGEAQEAFRQTLLVQLANAFVPGAVIQYPAEVAARILEPLPPSQAKSLPPRLYGTFEASGDAGIGVTLSSAKLTLGADGTDPAAFLTSVVELSFKSDQIAPACVSVSGRFQCSDLEHQIGTVPGIENYQASSWLGFPVPLADSQAPLLGADLAGFAIPVVVRSYPATPSLDQQAGEHVDPPGGADSTLANARTWRYTVRFSRPIHYPQDRLTFKVTFNHQDLAFGRLLLAADEPDTVEALGEFMTAYPGAGGVGAAIESALRPVTPESSPDDVQQAWAALASAVALVERVAGALARESGPSVAPRRSRHALRLEEAGADPAAPYDFVLVDATAANSTTYVLVLDGTVPAGIATPDLQIPDCPHWTSDRSKDGQEEWVPGEWRQRVQERKAFAFRFLAPDLKTPLKPDQGRIIPGRIVVLDGLDILSRQDALTGVYVERNALLVPDRETAQPFVYRTSQIEFPNPLRPTVAYDKPLVVSAIPAGGGPHVKQSLRLQLGLLFDALFKDAPPANAIQLVVSYSYPLNPQPDLPWITVPVLMLPLTSITKDTGSGPGSDPAHVGTVLDDVAAAIGRWFAQNATAGSGQLVFQLTVMSHLTKTATPLLQLTNVQLPLADIEPPLCSRCLNQ